MIKLRTHYQCEVTFYSKEVFLASCFHHGIRIFDFQIVDTYVFRFLISKSDYRKISRYYLELKVLKTYGIGAFFDLVLLHKVAFACLILSFCLYGFLNTRVYTIRINGNSDSINAYIRETIRQLGVAPMKSMPSNRELKELETILKMDLIEKVDLISVNSQGTYIFINYEKKGDEVVIEQKNGKMYASKDGVIKAFEIESGKIVREVNDYVRKGDLLVDDTITYKDKSYVVGTLGKVLAYTYNRITLSCVSTNMEKSEIYHFLLTKARYEVSRNFDASSYIDKEIILSYTDQNGVANMAVHYTLVENIVSY